MIPGFDEKRYLNANPDVAEATRRKEFSSGWNHFIRYGHKEDRSETPHLPPALHRLLHADPLAMPPAHLIEKVSGTASPGAFSVVGRLIAYNVKTALDFDDYQMPDSPTILDFGCGCCRVLPWMRMLYPTSVLYGCDIEQDLIDWSAENMSSVAHISKTEPMPPLPYADDMFDIVFSISVFTHLPEDMQNAWLKELARIINPGGRIILTILGNDLSPPGSNKDDACFKYVPAAVDRGFPDFYQNTFHARAYIEREWSKIVQVDRIIPRGCNNHQDLVICRRRA